MRALLKAPKLMPGDQVATVSLSWGGAGDEEILWRYEQGKKRLEEVFELNVVEMPHALKGSEFIYEHPELRAEDMMRAFKDPEIKGIITCIGGIESIRMLPYIDFEVIRDNPKVFLGYSDSTTSHMICLKAGITSIYGPTILIDFAENVEMNPYTIDHLKRTLFNNEVIGSIEAAKEWTSENLPWLIENKDKMRQLQTNEGYECLQGSGVVRGSLLGGCIEVFDTLRGTELFPALDDFDDAILFFETSEDKPAPWYIECVLRTYGILGILSKIQGMIWGKPQDMAHYDDYKEVIKKVLKEFGADSMPVLCNMNFGHTEPKFCLPYGVMAEIDTKTASFRILESGVK